MLLFLLSDFLLDPCLREDLLGLCLLYLLGSRHIGQSPVGDLLSDVTAEADDKVMAAVRPGHLLALQVEDREGMDTWFVIADAELSVCVMSPAPG